MCCNKILIKIFIIDGRKISSGGEEKNFLSNSIKRDVAIDFFLVDNKLIHIAEKKCEKKTFCGNFMCPGKRETFHLFRRFHAPRITAGNYREFSAPFIESFLFSKAKRK